MRIRLITLCSALIFTNACGCPAWAADPRFTDWATVSNPLRGFQIAYPASVFVPSAGPVSQDGQVFVSRDGSAKLIVGAFANDSGTSMLEYRAQLLTENYQGAEIEYGPVKRNWFVVSGRRGDMEFYERVSFTCDGQLINSWALLYPVSQAGFYDRVVEAVARTYTPGAGEAGQCGGL